ncbi:MAG TPA: hypothetical protein VMH02_07815 [Verrucomicrobiae bacterium]|nr:hypothetical protein [Verrucomicrobiae bacterium]
MSFILRWLGLDRAKAPVGLRPHRDLELALPYDAAYDKALEAFDLVLGANVWIDDRRAGLIEAGFGLVNTERVRATLQAGGDALTRVHVEAFYPAGAAVPESSRYVDALAAALEPDAIRSNPV